MGAELPVCPRTNARMCTYMYTYVYVVLSDGTRGCCGLIYRLSLPWKPRRDRLARHPHIRVDSGLLYSPPRLTRFCSHPPTSPLYTHRSISYSSSLSLPFSSSHPLPHPLTYLRPPLSVRLYPPLLSFFTVHAIYVPSSHATPSLFLSMYSPYVFSPLQTSLPLRFFHPFILL